MPDRSTFATGETVQVGARVDDGVYAAFREWVEEQTGKQYNEVGNALERAMLEYMDNDRYQRIEDELTEVKDQVRRNEALLRQVVDTMDGEKQKDGFSAPSGNAPGSRRQREAVVVQGIVANGIEEIKLGTLEEAIREFAKVSSDPTVRDYVDALTDTAAFQSHPNGNTWRVDHDGARDVLEDRGIDPSEVVA